MRKVQRWSPEEVDYLKKFSSSGIKTLIKKLPHRTESAIKVKCCYLGLNLGGAKEVTERLYMVV